MKFEFNSLDELDGFMQYLFKTREAGARSVGASPALAAPFGEATEVPDAHLTTEERAAALQAYDATTPATVGHLAVDAGGNPTALVVPVQEPADPPKRKRRTKAEIEADRARIQADVEAKMRAEGQQFVRTGDVQAEAPTDAQATAATSPLAGANPFDASTSNEPAATAALNEAPAGATGTLAALGSEVASATQSAVDGLGADVDPQSYIALRVAEMGGAFDAREHMKKCVEFIGALGKARYDEAFDLAGTSRAVASYTPADCAKHIAALEYLQIAG